MSKQLDSAAVAELLGIDVTSVHRYNQASYRDKYGFPEPDGHIGRTPWWFDTTIREWMKTRPGAGAGGGPKPKERTR